LHTLADRDAGLGCAAETSHGTVQGTVTLDGTPLANGLIRFVPANGESPTAETMITDGKFTVKVPVGDKSVSISAPKVIGKRQVYETADGPTIDVIEELLPPRYNIESELTLTVTPGQQQQDFELTNSSE
jgi:hypothetical protein